MSLQTLFPSSKPGRAAAALLSLAIICVVTAIGRAEILEFPLSPGDLVKIDILDDEKEPTDQTIALDGSVQAPFLGSVQIAGLSVAQALETLNRRYVEQHVFVVPKIGFAVVAYRPIFVVGQVRQPGTYPFQAGMSVEKAIAVAGGQAAADPVEDPILARARLRGELETAEANIIREALAYARLTAELAGRTDILSEDIPAAARDFMIGPLADSILDVEQRIARAEMQGFAAQETVLGEQIQEAERGLSLLNKVLENVDRIIEIAQSDLARTETLRKKGLNTEANISNSQRALAEQQGRQLQIMASLSDGRRNIGLLKSRLVELSQTRRVTALVELQTHNVNLATFLAERRKTEEQLVLMSSLNAEKLEQNKQVVLDFKIRRDIGADTVELPATSTSMMAPGDVLVVAIRDNAKVATLPAVQP